MCLEVLVAPAASNKVSAERLSEASGLRIVKTRWPTAGFMHLSVDGGCSCSLMTDNADWNSPTWEFQPSVLEGIAAALRLLAKDAEGFTFQALWIGDEIESRQRVPLRDVIDDVLENKIKNKHLYIIGKAKG